MPRMPARGPETAMTMANWLLSAMDALWLSAWAVVPAALLAAAICRWAPCRPATRHSLWLMVLLLPIAIPILPGRSYPASPAPEPIVNRGAESPAWIDRSPLPDQPAPPKSADVRAGLDWPQLLARGPRP